MNFGRRAVALAAAVAATAAAVLAATAADTPTTLTGNGVVATRDGLYKIQNDEWASSAGSVTTDRGDDFTVASPSISPDFAAGEPGGYPSIYQGCHWGNCSGGPLAAHPVREGTGVTSSWSTTQPGGSSVYNVAYDAWFNSAPRTSGRPDCAELMVWLNHNGPVQPAGSRTGTATIGGTRYSVWYGKGGWTTISYVMRPATSVHDLNIGGIARDAVRRGYLSASCYLVSVEGGFEVWRGGQGLATNSFSVHVHGRS